MKRNDREPGARHPYTTISTILSLALLTFAGCGKHNEAERTGDKPVSGKPAGEAATAALAEAQFKSYLALSRQTATEMASGVGDRFHDNGKVDDEGSAMLHTLYNSEILDTWKKLGMSDAQTCAMFLETYKGILAATRPWATRTGFGTDSKAKVAADALMQAAKESWAAFETQLRSVASNDPTAVNIRDTEGYTPLMYAAQEGQVALTKWLLSSGADPKLRNARDQTALDLAQVNNQTEVVSLLNGPGAR